MERLPALRLDRMRSRGLAGVFGVLLAFAPAVSRATIYEFTIDPAQSWLEVNTAQSGMRFTVPGPFEGLFVAVAPQSGAGISGGTLPGGTISNGTRTSLSGRIRANVSPTQVSFLSQSTLVTIGNFGSFLPGTAAAPATPAPANLAVSFDDMLLGLSGDLVLRNGKFSMFGDDIPITASPTPGLFTFSPGFSLTPAWMDGSYTSDVNGVLSSLVATNIQPFGSNSVQASFQQLPGGRLRLTLPYLLQNTPFGFPLVGVPLPANLEVRVTGQIVATAPEASTSLPAILALLGLVWWRRRGRPLRRGVLATLAALLLLGAACIRPPEYDPGADEPLSTDTSNEFSAQACSQLEIQDGLDLFADQDCNHGPNEDAGATLPNPPGSLAWTATGAAERTTRPFISGDVWSWRVRFDVSNVGSPLSWNHTNSIEGSFDYSFQVPSGQPAPTVIPVTLVDTVVGADPGDQRTVTAQVACDGLPAVAPAPNESTRVPINGSGTSFITGSCTLTLEQTGVRTNVATTDYEATAEIFAPRVASQATLTRCAERDPANPYPRTDIGGCGNGIGTGCLNDAHCAPGYYCSGVCRIGATGDPCVSDDQCQSADPNAVCAHGVCGPSSAGCEPVSQSGCGANQKCDTVAGLTPQGQSVGVTRCTDDGEAAEGAACLPISAGSTSCVAGTTCEGEVCRRWCHTAADCGAGEACDVTKGSNAFDPGRDLAEGDGGRCKDAASCLGCR